MLCSVTHRPKQGLAWMSFNRWYAGIHLCFAGISSKLAIAWRRALILPIYVMTFISWSVLTPLRVLSQCCRRCVWIDRAPLQQMGVWRRATRRPICQMFLPRVTRRLTCRMFLPRVTRRPICQMFLHSQNGWIYLHYRRHQSWLTRISIVNLIINRTKLEIVTCVSLLTWTTNQSVSSVPNNLVICLSY